MGIVTHGSQDSFALTGAGILYMYDKHTKTLALHDLKREIEILTLTLTEEQAARPALYAEMIERAAQINALVFSNHESLTLPDIFDRMRLRHMLKACAQQAGMGFDLATGAYGRFGDAFARQHTLHRIELVRDDRRSGQQNHYKASLETHKKLAVIARSATLYQVIRKLSERTVHDLIARAYGYQSQNEAEHLLMASSTLATLSKIVNKDFTPRYKIAHKNNPFAARETGN